jgi:hypothetical protein
MDRKQHRTMRVVAAVALALGVAGGSYGIAGAASSSGSSSGSGVLPAALSADAAQPAAQPRGWGPQRSDETLLTGATASKVRAAAVAKEPGATVSRVETDADGHAAYEVHMVRSDGTLVTVYVDEQFDVVGEETGRPTPAGRPTA